MFRTTIGLLLALLGTTTVFGQLATDRHGHNRPLLVPACDVPKSRVTSLVFHESGASRWLLAGGEDKRVYRWRMGDNHFVPEAPLRWPSFLGRRGSIYTMASAKGDRLAVAGVGVVSPQVTLLDVNGRTSPRTLVDNSRRRQNVWSIAADREGRFLFCGESTGANGNGHLLVWDTAKDATEAIVACFETPHAEVKRVAVSPDGAVVLTGGPNRDRSKRLLLLWDARKLRSRMRSPRETDSARLFVKDVAPFQTVELGSSWRETIRGLTWTGPRTWNAATVLGTVSGTVGGAVDKAGFESALPGFWRPGYYLKRGTAGRVVVRNDTAFPLVVEDRKSGKKGTLTAGRAATFGADAEVWVVQENQGGTGPYSGLAGFELVFQPYVMDVEAAGDVLLRTEWFDQRSHIFLERDGQPVPLPDSTFHEVTATALSADGSLAAVSGAEIVGVDDREVAIFQTRVWSTTDEPRLVASIPDLDAAPQTGGPIAVLATVAESGKTDSIVYRHGIPTAVGESVTRFKLKSPDIVHDPDGISTLEQKSKRSFPFVSGREVGSQPVTGGTVNALTGKFSPRGGDRLGVPMTESFMSNGKTTIGPFYTGPENPPTCCVQFRSGSRSFVAVGLTDGVQLWDLDACRRGEGLAGLQRMFYGHEGQVTSVDVSSDGNQIYSASTDGTISGWRVKKPDRTRELGLAVDDGSLVVSSVRDGSPGFYAGFRKGVRVKRLLVHGRSITGARNIAFALEHPLPGLEYFCVVESAGREVSLQTPVMHDALWTYYPRLDQKWVMWTPQGFYNTSEANSTRERDMIEWVVNLTPSDIADGAESAVVEMASVDHASLAVTAQTTGIDEENARANEARRQLERALLESEPADAGTTPAPPPMRLAPSDRGGWTFTTSPAPTEPIVRMEVWLNGRRITSRDVADRGQVVVDVHASQIEAATRSGRNTVVGVAIVDVAGKRTSFRQIKHFDSAGSRPARLHFLSVAVENAEGQRKLETVRRDHELIAEAIRDASSSLGSARSAGVRFDARPLGAFKVLHGGNDSPDAPTAERVIASFKALRESCRPDDLAVIVLSSHGELLELEEGKPEYVFHASDRPIRQKQMTDAIATLPCRTLLVLDTCHSGAGAGSQRQLQTFARVVNGPMVLTACAPTEEAYFDVGDFGHGFFLAAVVEGLRGTSIVDEKLAARLLEATGRDVSLQRKPDGNGDGWVSVEEFARFVQTRTGVLKTAFGVSREQNPQVLPSVFFTDSASTPIAIAD